MKHSDYSRVCEFNLGQPKVLYICDKMALRKYFAGIMEDKVNACYTIVLKFYYSVGS
jgi:hypothetical protein